MRGMSMCLAVLLSMGVCAPSAHADATLSILYAGSSGPFIPGELVHVNVRVSDIPLATPAAGFQAFLQFDTTRLAFVRGAYTSTPFPLHVIVPVVANGNQINLAAGVNFLIGTPPTTTDSDLASLTFQVLTECGVGAIEFRTNEPPTNLSTMAGLPILPLNLVSLLPVVTCDGDLTGDNIVDVSDLLVVITHWGRCPPAPPCCIGDTNNDSVVDVTDLLKVITTWDGC